jgi:hypothetical protein
MGMGAVKRKKGMFTVISYGLSVNSLKGLFAESTDPSLGPEGHPLGMTGGGGQKAEVRRQ